MTPDPAEHILNRVTPLTTLPRVVVEQIVHEAVREVAHHPRSTLLPPEQQVIFVAVGRICEEERKRREKT